ncbi:hypothetical protein [Frankia sp. R82]|uniref:hypothetical protein n=1 Tax=Frankia sp. R82 TaxID=2950553 RepID=UPI0020446208|nr:hypothetical protein [Frankia sp. R82]MCM3883303.1 hypothetical protein [Frankia sp. R82]
MKEGGFWFWAVVETLRHTGVRIEELPELTRLSLRYYTAPTAGTLVPLLHIVAGSTDVERLVPASGSHGVRRGSAVGSLSAIPARTGTADGNAGFHRLR